eukprot:TRINITY_DN75180_c0_g1_i1.p1 TRINITY_DN75180_c0_g1~~TRINITY_DN75180_c0_g1_i1.p1  ORF type:complete len:428 (+),score=49.76 TRINITY_DN75180_c0_g1_i1:121-1284(+)
MAPATTLAPAEKTLFRPSRTCYPGSRFGPKSRHDMPRRFKAYGNADEGEAVLFQGSSLEQPTMSLCQPATTPRGPRVLGDAGRSLFHPLAERNLPELPLIDAGNDVHGILVIGGKGAGKTSLVVSFLAMINGAYPSRRDSQIQERRRAMPTYGQCYELPEREVRFRDGSTRDMRLVLTDTPACGVIPREEQPLCASVSPNSTQSFSAIPSWMRITMRSGNFPHYSVLVVIDSTAAPLWQDTARCRDFARLFAVLKRNQYTVVIVVTKLLKARQAAQRNANYGSDHGGEVGKDPRSSYEAFVSRYLEKTCTAIQAKATENNWAFSQGPEAPAFPLTNVTMFDAPTWESIGDYRMWQEVRASQELPNAKYMHGQLNRILLAASVRSHAD